MTQKNEPLITALYERLSRDDNQQGDSNSIVNQDICRIQCLCKPLAMQYNAHIPARTALHPFQLI